MSSRSPGAILAPGPDPRTSSSRPGYGGDGRQLAPRNPPPRSGNGNIPPRPCYCSHPAAAAGAANVKDLVPLSCSLGGERSREALRKILCDPILGKLCRSFSTSSLPRLERSGTPKKAHSTRIPHIDRHGLRIAFQTLPRFEDGQRPRRRKLLFFPQAPYTTYSSIDKDLRGPSARNSQTSQSLRELLQQLSRLLVGLYLF